MEIRRLGNICLIIHVPSLKSDVKQRICLLVSDLLRLVGRQNAVSKEGLSKPEF